MPDCPRCGTRPRSEFRAIVRRAEGQHGVVKVWAHTCGLAFYETAVSKRPDESVYLSQEHHERPA